MPDRRDRGRFPNLRWWLAGLAALALLAAYHAWWLVRMRHHYPVDIDEAGYISIALRDLGGLRAGGLGGLWDAVQQQPPHAPLVPLLAVPALAVHKAILPAYAVEILALIMLVLATFGLGRRLAGPRWGVLAAASVACAPGVLAFTREFSFALPCAAALTVSMWALVRSEHLTRLGPALLWGAGGGAAVLARTMALGFVPGLLAAGLLLAATAPARARRTALVNLLVGAASGVAVAAVWYWRNLPYVLDYLRGYGYGEQAGSYGAQHSVLSVAWWLKEARVASDQLLYVPLLVVLAMVALAALPAALRALREPGRRALLARVLRSPATAVALVPVGGYVALSSTANNGSAFALPLLPAAVVLAIAVAARLPTRRLRGAAALAFAAVASLQLVSFAQVGGPLERLWIASPPLLHKVPILDPRVLAVQAVAMTQNELRFGPRDRGWLEAAGRVGYLAARKASAEGRGPVLAFANCDRLLNLNTVMLADLLDRAGVSYPIAQLTPAAGDTVAAYRRFLADPAYGWPNVLATAADGTNDYQPCPTQAHVAAAARSLGFEPFASVRQPNGEVVRLWWLARGATVPAVTAPPPRVRHS